VLSELSQLTVQRPDALNVRVQQPVHHEHVGRPLLILCEVQVLVLGEACVGERIPVAGHLHNKQGELQVHCEGACSRHA
jgi:hypothetical protein